MIPGMTKPPKTGTRERFLVACHAAEVPIRVFVRDLPPDARARNPFLFVLLQLDAPPPPGVPVLPEGLGGVGVDVRTVYAVDLETELAALPVNDTMRERLRKNATSQPLTLGRLPYVRIVLCDTDGAMAAFGRIEDDMAGSATN